MNFYTLKIAGVSVQGAIDEIIRYLIFGLFLCLPLILGKYYSIQSTVLILIAIIISGIYYSIILHRDTQLKKGLFDFVRNSIQK
jgi:hypothetical protein